MITPLVRGEGQDVIMVNRGFIKRENKEKADRIESLVRSLLSPFPPSLLRVSLAFAALRLTDLDNMDA